VIAALPEVWTEWQRRRQGGSAPRPPVLTELARPASA
jgi:hypothetical protein